MLRGAEEFHTRKRICFKKHQRLVKSPSEKQKEAER